MVETLNDVKVIRCPILLNKKGNDIWRLLAPLSFALGAAPVVFWRILQSRPHVVLCIEPTLFSAPAAVLAAKLVGARRVLHVQDLEVDVAFAVGHLKGRIIEWLAFGFERFILRRFQAVVTISERMRERLAAKGVPAERLSVVRNWVDLEKIKPLDGPNAFRAEMGLSEDDFVVLYAGQIGLKQALDLVFNAAEILRTEKHIHFVVVGDGPLKSRYVTNHENCPNVHFLPLQSEEKLCELLNLADLHVLPQNCNAADVVLPSKLAGMLASGKPVLAMANPGTELDDLLQGAAIVIEPGDAEMLSNAILAAVSHLCPEISARAAKLVELFARRRNLQQFARTIIGQN